MNHPIWYMMLFFLVMASIITRYQLLLFFAVLMGLASLASGLWRKYCLAGVTYRRKLGSDHLRYGEETTLAVEVVNAKPLPLAWLHVLDAFPPNVTLLTEVRNALGRAHGLDFPLLRKVVVIGIRVDELPRIALRILAADQ